MTAYMQAMLILSRLISLFYEAPLGQMCIALHKHDKTHVKEELALASCLSWLPCERDKKKSFIPTKISKRQREYPIKSSVYPIQNTRHHLTLSNPIISIQKKKNCRGSPKLPTLLIHPRPSHHPSLRSRRHLLLQLPLSRRLFCFFRRFRHLARRRLWIRRG